MYARFLISGLFATVLLLTACNPAAPQNPALDGAVVPTRMATATATFTPTIEPSPTATLTPTASPTATATATITPSPTPDVPTVEIGSSSSLITSGELAAENPRQRYIFVAQAGDLINLSMISQGQAFSPVLVLEDAAGTSLAQSQTFPDATIENFLIPEDGTYRVLATVNGGLSSNASFDFRFQRIVGAEFDPATGILIIPIPDGERITGSITDNRFFTSYSFTANAGDNISIEMITTSGNLDPYLVLVHRETRQVIIEADDLPGSLNALIERIDLPESGSYIVLASRYGGESGTTMGNFSLRLIRN